MIRIETKPFLALLDDLARTTSGGEGPTGGILLHTARGPKADEPGMTDLLVGTSTNNICVGHTYIESAGQLAHPTLWPLDDVRAVISSFKSKVQGSKDHAVDVVLDGGTVIVREDANLFDGGLHMTFAERVAEHFPRGLWRAVLTPPYVPDDANELQARSDFHATTLKPFHDIARRRNAPLQLYRYHQTARWLVQIGDTYRGSVMPFRSDWSDGSPNGDEPGGDVYAADFGDDE